MIKYIPVTILSVCIVCFCSISYAQNNNAIYFGLGTEVRAEPQNIPITSYDIDQSSIFIDVNDQLSGAALNYFISFYWSEYNVEFGFSQSLRYDHLYFNTDSLTLGTNNLYSSKNVVLSDFNLYIHKHFKLKRNVNWNIYAGYSLMNRGSKYLYTESYIQNPLPFPLPFPIPGTNILVTEVKEGNFNIDAFNFGIGIGINKLSFDLGAYYTTKHNYSTNDDIIIPRAKISYRILNLND